MNELDAVVKTLLDSKERHSSLLKGIDSMEKKQATLQTQLREMEDEVHIAYEQQNYLNSSLIADPNVKVEFTKKQAEKAIDEKRKALKQTTKDIVILKGVLDKESATEGQIETALRNLREKLELIRSEMQLQTGGKEAAKRLRESY